MRNVRLTRISAHPKHGTFGSLVVDNRPVCNTLEPYHRDNAEGISCIPAGQYLCEPYDSPSYGDTHIVTGVQDRSAVLFHWGNRDINTKGCIILGEEFGSFNGDWALLSSKRACNEFHSILGGEEFMLTVVNCF